MDFTSAVAHSDYRTVLEGIRDRLVAELEPTEHVSGCECNCGPLPSSGRDVAALVKELRSVVAEIDRLPKVKEGDPLDAIAGAFENDELAARRATRQPGAAA